MLGCIGVRLKCTVGVSEYSLSATTSTWHFSKNICSEMHVIAVKTHFHATLRQTYILNIMFCVKWEVTLSSALTLGRTTHCHGVTFNPGFFGAIWPLRAKNATRRIHTAPRPYKQHSHIAYHPSTLPNPYPSKMSDKLDKSLDQVVAESKKGVSSSCTTAVQLP